MKPVNLFYSYAHEDRELLGELRAQLAILRRDGSISEWHDRDIGAGTDWNAEIRRELETADLVLILVSPDFINSDYCWSKELKLALDRHEQGRARLIPIILRPCSWQDAPFAKLQALPFDSRAVTTWSNRDEAFADIAKAIRKVVRGLRSASVEKVPRSPPEPEYPRTRIFGRTKVATEIVLRLTRTQQPIVIKGFGGIGKSTLAILVSNRCIAKRLVDAVIWIDLRDYGGRAEGENLLHKVFDNISRAVDPNSPLIEIGIDAKTTAVIDVLSRNPNRYLLVFDNYESVLSAITVSKIDVATALAHFIDRTSRHALVLITTRELPALVRPIVRELSSLDPEASRQLIVARLSDQELKLPDAETAEIYSLTYGIPKLIELTASLCRSIPIRAIKDKLALAKVPLNHSDDVYGYLFNEAWHKLSAAEQHVLLVMVLFSGFALSDALQATSGLSDQMFWNAVQQLELISLLVVRKRLDGATLYSIHPLTQRLCEAELKGCADFAGDASSRFVYFYLDRVSSVIEGDLRRLELDIDNLMSAIRIAYSRSLWHDLSQFRGPTNQFLWTFGYWRHRVEADKLILRAARELDNVPLVASILVEDLGYTYLRFEDIDQAEAYVREGLELFQQSGVLAGQALAARHLGKAALLRAEYELLTPGQTWGDEFAEAERLYEQSLKIREELRAVSASELVSIADLKLDIGRLYWLWGRKFEYVERHNHQESRNGDAARMRQQALARYAQAVVVSEEAKSLFADCGHEKEAQRGVAKAWGNLGNACKERGFFFRRENQFVEAEIEFDKAEQAFGESLKIAIEIHRLDEIAHAKWGLAEIYEVYSDVSPLTRHELLTKALRHAQQAHDAYRQLATPHDIGVTAALRDRIAAKVATPSAQCG